MRLNEDHLLGKVLEVIQLFKKDERAREGGTIILPLNMLGVSAINRLEDIYEATMLKLTPEDKFKSWFVQPENKTKQNNRKKPNSPPVEAKGMNLEELSIERLRKPIPSSPFIIEDVVYGIMNQQRFAEPIRIELHQMKPIIYYGFQEARDMITGDVSKILLELNINFDYKRVGSILKELNELKLLPLEEKISKNNRKYKIWKFTEIKTEME